MNDACAPCPLTRELVAALHFLGEATCEVQRSGRKDVIGIAKNLILNILRKVAKPEGMFDIEANQPAH